MRRIILAIAAAAVIGTGLAATAPAKADWYYGGGYYHNDWRAREWREHQEWAWRHHHWHQWQEFHGNYWQPGAYRYR